MDRQQKLLFHMERSGDVVAVESFYAEEALSCPFSLTVNIVSQHEHDLQEALGSSGCLTIVGACADRFFHGVISSFTLTGLVGQYYSYQIVVVPAVSLLGLNINFRIFQNLSTVNIVKNVLDNNGLSADQYEFRLLSKYSQRRYCTQYGESDLRFISRILEEEGIFYFFEHTASSHKIVFGDSNFIYQEIVGDTAICYHDAGLIPEKEVIGGLSYNRSIYAGKITHTNYNFKRPSLDMMVVEKGESYHEYEIYEYPGPYGLPAEGQHRVQTRLQEQRMFHETLQGRSNYATFAPGFCFTASGHFYDKVNTQYGLVTVAHSGSQGNVYGEYSGIGGDYSYSNSFVAIPSSVLYRPERTLDKPLVKGLQTGIVVGPSGEEIYCDEYGRVKVQFHWDREGRRSERSSCWLRINQPWSGKSWGNICVPRVGDEVLIAFINGDPDWPIVVGSLNNAASPALYPLPAHKTRSGVKTRSYPDGGPDNFHELRFEDKKGSEEIYLQSERDWNILVKNDKGQTVGNDEILLVKNDRKKTVLMNESTSIGVNRSIKVGANQDEQVVGNVSLSVGANKSEMVGANSAETVGLAKEVTVGGLLQVSVGGVMNETVAGAKTEEVGLAKAVLVGADMTENVIGGREVRVGKSLEIVAGDSVVISCGKSTLRLNSDGSVYINGAELDLSASGVIKVAGKDVRLN